MKLTMADGRALACPHCESEDWHEVEAHVTFRREDSNGDIRASTEPVQAAVCVDCGHVTHWLREPAAVELYARSRREAEALGLPVPPRRTHLTEHDLTGYDSAELVWTPADDDQR